MKRAMSLMGIKKSLQSDIDELILSINKWTEKALYFGRHRQYTLMNECLINRDKAKAELSISIRMLKSFNS